MTRGFLQSTGTVLAGLVLMGGLMFSGCQRQEKVLDIEGPGVDIEVRKPVDPIDVDGGGVDIDVDRN